VDEDNGAVVRVGATGAVALVSALALGTGVAVTAVSPVAVGAALEAIQAVQGRARESRELKQAAVLHACATRLGLPAPVLAAALSDDDRVVTAAQRILEAAAETAWIAKLALLGELLADATRPAPDALRARRLVETAAVAELEEPHVRLLATIATRRDPEPPDGFTAWSYDQILKELPDHEGVLDSLLATLTRHGLAYDAATGSWSGVEGNSFWGASPFGRQMLVAFTQAAQTVREAQDAAG
jgi:hypothetical protein